LSLLDWADNSFGGSEVVRCILCPEGGIAVKSHWFHLMPYKYLPEDFKDRYRSVWVDVPSELYNPVKGHEIYNEYLDELEYADRMGFDGVVVNEHHANAYGLMPSPNIMLACLARRTSNAALIVLGNSIALYNPPLRVAEEKEVMPYLREHLWKEWEDRWYPKPLDLQQRVKAAAL
jgi:hypothetical protein